jgi:hypothetical protein
MILRNIQESDLPFILEVRNDESTRHFLKTNSIFSLEQSKEWFKTTNPKWFIIEVENERVGYIRTDGNEIGLDIHPKHRKKGYAKNAYKIYLKDKTYASLWVFNDNFAKQLYLDLGFKETKNTEFIRERLYIEMEYSIKH